MTHPDAFTLAGLWIYPVKSFGGMQIAAPDITPEGGFAGDREWIVVRPDGEMVWQGDIPRMTLMSARLDAGELHLSAPDGSTMSVPRDQGGPKGIARQYGFDFNAIDQGDAVSDWLGAHLQEPVRLVRIGAQAHQWPKVNLIHVVSLNSLAALNAAQATNGLPPTEVERFRPNVVLAGDHPPFAEETTPFVDLGTFGLEHVVSSGRCELVNIRRETAKREIQPLKTIGKLAKGRPASLPAGFGVYAKAVAVDTSR